MVESFGGGEITSCEGDFARESHSCQPDEARETACCGVEAARGFGEAEGCFGGGEDDVAVVFGDES